MVHVISSAQLSKTNVKDDNEFVINNLINVFTFKDQKLPTDININTFKSTADFCFPLSRYIVIYILKCCLTAPDIIKREFEDLINVKQDEKLYLKKWKHIKNLFNNNLDFYRFKSMIEQELCHKDLETPYYFNLAIAPFAIDYLNSYIKMETELNNFEMNLFFIFNFIHQVETDKNNNLITLPGVIKRVVEMYIDGFSLTEIDSVFFKGSKTNYNFMEIYLFFQVTFPQEIYEKSPALAFAKYMILFKYLPKYDTSKLSKKEKFIYYYSEYSTEQ